MFEKSKLLSFAENFQNVYVNTGVVIFYLNKVVLGVGLIWWVYSSLFIHERRRDMSSKILTI